MPVKEIFRQMPLVRLYLMLGLTLAFFSVELVASHVTHSLTLLVDAYHSLCNLIALGGCIITIKYMSSPTTDEEISHENKINNSITRNQGFYAIKKTDKAGRSIRNTFGWARVDVLVMLMTAIFLSSLCFLLIVESLQTLFHIGHHDAMHHPLPVLGIAIAGLAVHAVCYALIGGYTFHQGSFLHLTADGNVVLQQRMSQKSVREGQRRLSAQTRRPTPPSPSDRQGCREMTRDIAGCALVALCAVIVHVVGGDIALYADPAIAIVSVILLMALSCPYMRESCLILLQTIPGHIDVDSFKAQLLAAFPCIVNIHDVHIWQLTRNKVISTAHIIFLNSKVYIRIADEVTEFFYNHGITQVTIQPEFFKNESPSPVSSCECILSCQPGSCESLLCCKCTDTTPLQAIEVKQTSSRKTSTSTTKTAFSKSDSSAESDVSAVVIPDARSENAVEEETAVKDEMPKDDLPEKREPEKAIDGKSVTTECVEVSTSDVPTITPESHEDSYVAEATVELSHCEDPTQ